MPAAEDSRRYLDPRVLARVGRLEVRTRQIVEGLMSGRHRSPHQGSSVEFAQHRQYVQGDDPRHIDWKVFGRSDKLYIKQFQEETQLQMMLVVDASESMNFGSVVGQGSTNGNARWSKYDHATAVAATLAFLATQQSDAVGLAVYDQVLSRYFKPSTAAGQWRTIVNELQAIPRWNKTGSGKILEQLAGKLRQRSLIVVLSDFFDDVEGLRRGLRALRFRKHDVVCMQMLDPQEIEFPFDNVTLFKGLEATGELLTEPRALRKAYLQVMNGHTESLKKACRSMDIDFGRFDTGQPLDVPLSTFLAAREATMSRV